MGADEKVLGLYRCQVRTCIFLKSFRFQNHAGASGSRCAATVRRLGEDSEVYDVSRQYMHEHL